MLTAPDLAHGCRFISAKPPSVADGDNNPISTPGSSHSQFERDGYMNLALPASSADFLRR